MEGRVLTLRTSIVRHRLAALIACTLTTTILPLSVFTANAEYGIPAGSGAVVTAGQPLVVRVMPGWDAEVSYEIADGSYVTVWGEAQTAADGTMWYPIDGGFVPVDAVTSQATLDGGVALYQEAAPADGWVDPATGQWVDPAAQAVAAEGWVDPATGAWVQPDASGGWVDPATGQWVDPAATTGWVDPATGQWVEPTATEGWVDPATGEWVTAAPAEETWVETAPVAEEWVEPAAKTGGWVDPATGQWVEPAATTGWVDPATGQWVQPDASGGWVDPATGAWVAPNAGGGWVDPATGAWVDTAAGGWTDPATGQWVEAAQPVAPVETAPVQGWIDPSTGQWMEPAPVAAPAEGWVDPATGQWVEPAPVEAQAAEWAQPAPATGGVESWGEPIATAYITGTSGDGAACRSAAAPGTSKIAVLAEGEAVEVRGEAIGEWQPINCAGVGGYVNTSLISWEPGGGYIELEQRRRDRNRGNNNNNNGGYSEEPYVSEAAIAAPAPETGSGVGNQIASFAQQYVGYPYAYAGEGPYAFDCSGFTKFVIQNTLGMDITHDMFQQIGMGQPVGMSELQPGDLVFFANTFRPGLSHAGIYIGGGQFVHSENESTGVIVSDLNSDYYGSRWAGGTRLA
jgi:cell wall-associated NlpC family hydrolase